MSLCVIRIKRIAIMIMIIMVILFMDIISKNNVVKYLSGSKRDSYSCSNIIVFENLLGVDFSLGCVYNKGAAWGIFKEYSIILFIARCLFVLWLIVYLFFNKNRDYDFPFILILSGAIGNIIDFVMRGYVVDMFHFIIWGYSFPLFNLADVSIFVGMIWIVFIPFFNKNINLNKDIKI